MTFRLSASVRAGLVDALLQQIEPFHPTFHYGEWSRPWRSWGTPRRRRSASARATAKALNARRYCGRGGGSFQPKKPPVPASTPMRENPSTTPCAKSRIFAENMCDRRRGDSALDWTLNLQPVAKHLTLVHARRVSRRPHSVKAMRNSSPPAHGLTPWPDSSLTGEAGELFSVTLKDATESRPKFLAKVSSLFSPHNEARPGRRVGLNLHENLVPVDTATFETNVPGVFAIATSIITRAS